MSNVSRIAYDPSRAPRRWNRHAPRRGGSVEEEAAEAARSLQRQRLLQEEVEKLRKERDSMKAEAERVKKEVLEMLDEVGRTEEDEAYILWLEGSVLSRGLGVWEVEEEETGAEVVGESVHSESVEQETERRGVERGVGGASGESVAGVVDRPGVETGWQEAARD